MAYRSCERRGPGLNRTMSDRVKLLVACSMVVAGLILCGVSAQWVDLPARADSDAGLTDDEPGFDPANFPVVTGTAGVDIDPSLLPTVAPRSRPTGAPTRSATPLAAAGTGPTPKPTPRPTATLPPLPGTLNIILLGSDRRPGEADWRTDTMIVVMIDPQARRVGAISIPRDIWVNIPGHDPNRVNALDEFGGPALVKRVVGSTLGIPIDYYVRVDFDGMVKAIDDIGGITVDVQCSLEEDYPDPTAPGGVRRLKVSPGRVRMTGQMALDFSRSRLSTSVLDRMRRQNRVLLGVREKLLSPDVFPRIPQLWSITSKLVETDLPVSRIVPLAQLASQLSLSSAHGLLLDYPFVTQTYSPQGWWILLPDLTAIRTAVRNIFTGATLTDAIKRPGSCA
jgi:LCP family protein required for cell wall assembly